LPPHSVLPRISSCPFSSAHRYLHSFPTRRSSDLLATTGALQCETHLFLFKLTVFHGQNASPWTSTSSPPAGGFPSRHCVAGVSRDRKSTRLNSSHVEISYAVFCLKKKKKCERRLL